jgi:Ca2+-binding EF-hand superfamily protein
MACFKRKYERSNGCRGKEKAYWKAPQGQGFVKMGLSSGGFNCWHMLPVLKGPFFTKDPLDNADVIKEEKEVKKVEVIPPLPDEAMTAVVLDEIYPKTPTRKGGKAGESSPEKDSPRKSLRCRSSTRRPTEINVKGVVASMGIATPSGASSGGAALLGSSGKISGSLAGMSKMDPPSPSSGAECRSTRSLAPLVYFREVLEEKYGSVDEGLDFWVKQFPSTNAMTKKEFRRILETRMGLQLPDEVREAIFSLLDLDGDGCASLSEFRVAIDAAAPVDSIHALRRRWLVAGFKSMNSALHAMGDSAAIRSKGLTLREFGEALNRVHVTEHWEHSTLFNVVGDPAEHWTGHVSMVELASAVATVSPHLLLEEVRERLMVKYRAGGQQALRRAWSDLELGGTEVNLEDFVKQSVRRFGFTDFEMAKLFRILDIEGNGYIDRITFLSALSLSEPSLFLEDLRRRIRQRFRSLKEVFSSACENPTMKLSFEKTQQLLMQIDLTASECETLYDLIDVEETGMLSVSEFLNGTYHFAPSCAFEDLRLLCVQRSPEIRSVFAVDDQDQVTCMDYASFVQLLRELHLDADLHLRAMFDLLDIQNKGFVTLKALIALLQAGGPGSSIKLEDEGLRNRAKQDIRSSLVRGIHLVGELKAEAREGRDHSPACSKKTLEDRPSTTASSRMGKGTDKRRLVAAPRLQPVPYEDIKSQVLHSSTIGPHTFGPHRNSRAPCDMRKTTENNINNPQSSWNTVWRNIQGCRNLDKQDKEVMERDVQAYYQGALTSLSSDVPLLEQPPSRHALHRNIKTHQVVLESESKRRLLNRSRSGSKQGESMKTQSASSLPSL